SHSGGARSQLFGVAICSWMIGVVLDLLQRNLIWFHHGGGCSVAAIVDAQKCIQSAAKSSLFHDDPQSKPMGLLGSLRDEHFSNSSREGTIQFFGTTYGSGKMDLAGPGPAAVPRGTIGKADGG